MRLGILIILFLLSTVVYSRHPVHFSVINMELKKDSMYIDYSIRVFQDDYISLVSQLYSDVLHNAPQNEIIVFDTTIIEKYFIKSFLLKLDDVSVSPRYISQRVTETDVWFNFRIKINQIPDIIAIKNRIFVDIFTDQTNLVIFSFDNYEKGLTFDAQTSEQLFSLKNILL